jgi:hypothetical protein
MDEFALLGSFALSAPVGAIVCSVAACIMLTQLLGLAHHSEHGSLVGLYPGRPSISRR